MAGRITAIEPQARHANRFNLYIENRFQIGLSAIVAARLHVGQVLSDEELAGLEHQELMETAHDKALSFLEPRPRSAAEIKQQLLKKKVPPDIIDQVLERLSAAGLVDDAAFARFWVENREEFRPRSARALRFELRRKGLSDAAIKGAVGSVDETESAYRAGLPRARRWSALDYRAFREKLGAFLMRRGFSYDTTRSVVDRLWKEMQGEESEQDQP